MSGGEFLVNTSTQNAQLGPNISALANGGHVVAWDDLSDGSIMVQIYGADGSPQGNEFQANTSTAGFQLGANVGALDDGGFVLVWEDRSSRFDTNDVKIRAQLIDADGVLRGDEFLVNSGGVTSGFAPDVAGLAGGGLVVAWQDRSGAGVSAQRYDASGSPLGGAFEVNSNTAGTQYTPSIAALSDGGFVVSWEDESGTLGDASANSVKAQRYDANGVAQAGELLVNTTTNDNQIMPSVADLPGGGFVIAWSDNSGSGSDGDYAIKVQRFGADGEKLGGELSANTTTDGWQWYPSVTGLADDSFVVVWGDTDGAGGDTSESSVMGRVFSADGAARGGEFLVNTTTENAQEIPSVEALSDGGFLVAWEDWSRSPDDTSEAAIRAQRYDADGSPTAPDGGVCAEIVDADGNLWDSTILLCDGTEFSAAETQVVRTYLGGLGRLPAQSGFDFWLGKIAEGAPLTNIAKGFVTAPEFITKADSSDDGQLSNAEFVNHMYVNVFGREPDQEGFDFWTGELDVGSKSQELVLVEMTQSNEYVNLTLSATVDYLLG